MDMTLFKDGIFVVVMGMGTVFLFLTILIWAINITEKVLKFFNKYFPEEIPETVTAKKKTDTKDEEIALAIACAFRSANK